MDFKFYTRALVTGIGCLCNLPLGVSRDDGPRDTLTVEWDHLMEYNHAV